jgi:hypothetical protein
MAKTYVIIHCYDEKPFIATREWFSTAAGWQWFINNTNRIEWVEEAECLLDEEVNND